MHGIAGDIALGVILAVLAVFCLVMAWAGIMITVVEPPEPLESRYEARHRREQGAG